MTLTSPPVSVAPFESGRLAAGISASATTITVSPIFKTVNGVRTKQGFDTTSGIAIISQGDFTERISFEGSSVDSTTKVTTLTTCVRGLSVTSTTASFSGGTGRIWPKGAKITLVADVSYFQSVPFKNVANTYTLTQTFSEAPVFSKGTHTTPFADTTARDAYFTAPTNGDECYVTGVGKQVYSGGSWVTTNAAGTSFATTTAAGTMEAGSVADNIAKTAAGTSGALVAVMAAHVVTDSTGAVNGSIAGLNASSVLDRTIGGLGTASGTAYGILANGTTSTGATQSISPSTAGKYLKSNGAAALPSFEDVSITHFDKTVAIASVELGTQTNPTTLTSSGNPAYTIPANDLINGVAYEVVAAGTYDRGTTTTVTLAMMLGSTGFGSIVIPSTASGSGNKFVYRGTLFGTAAAGGSVAVRGVAGVSVSTAATPAAVDSSSVATNGTLAFNMGALFGTSNGANTITWQYITFTRKSTTAS